VTETKRKTVGLSEGLGISTVPQEQYHKRSMRETCGRCILRIIWFGSRGMGGHYDGLMETWMGGLLCKLVDGGIYIWIYENYVQFTHINNYVLKSVKVYENFK
jgi:hypothetical protein